DKIGPIADNLKRGRIGGRTWARETGDDSPVATGAVGRGQVESFHLLRPLGRPPHLIVAVGLEFVAAFGEEIIDAIADDLDAAGNPAVVPGPLRRPEIAAV